MLSGDAMFKKFKFRETYRGATLIEYVLIASLLGVSLIGVYRNMGNKYTDIYRSVSDPLNKV